MAGKKRGNRPRCPQCGRMLPPPPSAEQTARIQAKIRQLQSKIKAAS